MRVLAVAVVVVGCGRESAKPTTPTNAQGPQIRFALTVGDDVQIVHVSDGKLVVERTTKAPAHVHRIFWVGPSPAVWLDMSVGLLGEGFPDEEFGGDEPPPPGPHSNEMGLVETTGYKKLALPAWPPAKRPNEDGAEDLREITVPNRALVVENGALWEKRCRWYGGPDGGWCSYEYARLYPPPVVFVDEKGLDAKFVARVFPDVAPSPTIELSFRERLRDPDPERKDEWDNQQRIVTCALSGGDEVEYPPAGTTNDHDVAGEAMWLSTEPPIFVTREGPKDYGVRMTPLYDKIWEGCAPSERYSDVFVGPDGVVVLTGDEVSVLQRGREIAHSSTGGSQVAFAPDGQR
jgi:hypothetical protein